MLCTITMPDGEVGSCGVFGYNASLDIDFSEIFKTTKLPTMPWDDDYKPVVFRQSIEYNPDGGIGCKIVVDNNGRIMNVSIECTQDEFITLARHLNTFKNRILKWRRIEDGKD